MTFIGGPCIQFNESPPPAPESIQLGQVPPLPSPPLPCPTSLQVHGFPTRYCAARECNNPAKSLEMGGKGSLYGPSPACHPFPSLPLPPRSTPRRPCSLGTSLRLDMTVRLYKQYDRAWLQDTAGRDNRTASSKWFPSDSRCSSSTRSARPGRAGRGSRLSIRVLARTDCCVADEASREG